jgi:hypothetical protein
MSTGFNDFCFYGPMPSFQFRKMRFHGHAEVLLSRIVAWWAAAAMMRSKPSTARNVPRWHIVKGVFSYRSGARREFPRSVASSTQFRIVPEVVFNEPSNASPVPLFPPPVDHLLGHKNCCSARPPNGSLPRLRRCMCNPRPLASAGRNLDLVPNAPVLHDTAPNWENKAPF